VPSRARSSRTHARGVSDHLRRLSGAGAWALVEWSRQYRNKFLETLLPKALAAKEKRPEDSQEAMVKAERKSLQELANSLKAFWEECKHSSLNEIGLAE
jgi:hypothetical protein